MTLYQSLRAALGGEAISGIASDLAMTFVLRRHPVRAAERPRPHPLNPRERLGERHRIGVAHLLRHRGGALLARREELRRLGHPPPREILERRLAHQLVEPRGERRARHRLEENTSEPQSPY